VTPRTIRFPARLRTRIVVDAERCGRSFDAQDGSVASTKDKLKLVVRTDFLQLAGREDYSCQYIFVSAHKL
jgi:hypothetical protein